jgi:branched-chain amino acid transport system permease protein
MTELVQQVIGGLATGSVYAALALALSVIYSGTGILNFAQGQMAVVAAFLAYTLVGQGWSVWLALPVVIAASAAMGALIERVFVKPVEGASPLARFSVTAALLLGINGLVSIIWDNDQHSFATPFGSGVLHLGSLVLTAQQIGSTAVVVLVMIAVAVFFHRSDLGLKMRAVAANPDSAVLLGIRPGTMLAMGWALAAAVGAVAGVMAAPTLSVSADMMTSPLLLALAASSLGGLGSRVGAVVGGLTIGVLDAMAGRYISALGSDLSVALPFAVIWVVLMVRPNGLFGKASAVRA